MRAARLRGDDGVATIVSVSIMAVLLTVAGALATYGGVVAARHQAEALADVAALAAAKHAEQGRVPACLSAGRLVLEQHAMLLGCRLDGRDAVVVVGMRAPGLARHLGLVSGEARAGRR